jgi:hypothetical protein
MPRVLTMTQNPEESSEQFAERISGQLDSFFNESTDETSPAPDAEPTDVSAAPEEEPAPSG